jgi:hypothetical protein
LAYASIPQPNLIIIQLIVVTYSSEQQHLFSRCQQQLQKPHDVRSQEKQEKKKKPLLSGVCVWIQDWRLLKTVESEVQCS